MSSENVQVVEAGLSAWSRGDLEGVLELCDPEIEYVTAGVFPGLASVYHGWQGFGRFWQDFRGPWEEITLTPDRLIPTDDDVVVLGRFEARGRDGISVGREVGMVFTVRDGVAARIATYPGWNEALEAAGLQRVHESH
jgi:ketosteroid isomerase-like protein